MSPLWRARPTVLAVAAGALLAGSLVSTPVAHAAVGEMAVFSMGPNSAPQDVAAGPDGNLWVTNAGSNTIVKVSTAGAVLQTFTAPTPNAGLRNITVGPDNNLWFTMTTANQIGRITTAGVVTPYSIPTANSQPYDIVGGPDGALWFTEFAGNKIGRITTAGVITTEYALPAGNSGPWGITSSPGNSRVYYSASGSGYVGYVDMAGNLGGLSLSNLTSNPRGVLLQQGSIWFALPGLNALGNLLSDSNFANISLGQQASYIALGPSNTMWLSTAANQVLQVSDRGAVVGSYPIPTANAQPAGLTLGPDQNMWVALPGANSIARVSTGTAPTNTSAPAVSPTSGIAVGTTLTSTNGTWNVVPSSYSYQWQRCSSTNTASCVNIAGATSGNYTVSAADSGQYLRSGVSGITGSGTSTPAYSAVVAGPPSPPAPNPTPAPAPGPTPSGGSVASIGSGATMELDAPAKQKRGKRKSYNVVFSATDVQGTVTLQFRKGSNRKTFTALPINDGRVEFAWKAPKNWPLKKTTVVATFVPSSGSRYTAGQVTDSVKITK